MKKKKEIKKEVLDLIKKVGLYKFRNSVAFFLFIWYNSIKSKEKGKGLWKKKKHRINLKI